MTALTEGALDLSAKPYDSKPPSPVHSFTSDVDMRADRPPSAVSSDADDSGIMSPRKRPAPGSGFSSLSSRGGSYSPRRYAGRSPRASPELSPASAGGSVGSTPRSSPATTASPTGHGIDCSPVPTSLASPTSSSNNNNNNSHPGSSPGLSPTGARPFKMYPFEPLPSMYSQLAAAAASQGMYGYSPSGPTPAMPAANLFDSAISFSSPIGQYLQQKKRRMEARDSSRPTNGHEPLSPTPAAGPPTSGGYISGGDEDSSDGGLSGMHNGAAGGRASGGRGSGGSGTVGDKKVIAVPDERKDEAYWERRRKNNEAAKRSRDARRAKEEEIALRAAFLEQENLKLRAQVAILKNETAKLHYMLYNRM